MPKVSIIINCYNGEKFLSETLKSIEKQTFSDYEIIFFDNASNDASAMIAHGFDSRLRYYRNDTTVSLGEARNIAIGLANSEYISFLDCDDLLEDTKLEEQVKILDNDKQCGIVFSNFYKLNMLTKCNKTYIAYKDTHCINEVSYEDFVKNYSYCLSTFMIRRSILKNLEFFFDNRLSFAEEFDFFLRLGIGNKIIYQSCPLATYRVHKTMTSKKLFDKIPDEYSIVHDNLIATVNGFKMIYPNIDKHLSYIESFARAKWALSNGDNRLARAEIEPYKKYNYRARCYLYLSYLPKFLSKLIYKMFYKNKI